jgi:hypothetical protein
MVAAEGFTFPLLYDESQRVARAYSAMCTPDTFLFGSDLKLVYRGQLDDSRPGSGSPRMGATFAPLLMLFFRGARSAGSRSRRWAAP